MQTEPELHECVLHERGTAASASRSTKACTAIEMLARDLAEVEAELDARLIELQHCDAIIHKLKSSISWRLTAPMRAVGSLFADLAHVYRRTSAKLGYILLHRPGRVQRILAERRTILSSGLFDSDFYLHQYPDVARAGVDPVLHYLRFGANEGRNPNPFFETDEYLARHPEIVKSGGNPLVHYIAHYAAHSWNDSDSVHAATNESASAAAINGTERGKSKREGYNGENGVAGFNKLSKTTVRRSMLSLDQQMKTWKRRDTVKDELDAERLLSLVLHHLIDDSRSLIISFGHNNYLKKSGGIELCIQRDVQAANAGAISYLNIHPWQPLPCLARTSDDPDPLVCLIMNNVELGVSRVSNTVILADNLRIAGVSIRVVIHSLLGHMPERIAEVAAASGHRECRLWLHDYFTICPNYTLLRNDMMFCNAPAVSSSLCQICRYGSERLIHQNRMLSFFKATAIHIIAPSEFAAQFWCKNHDLPYASITVQPHLEIVKTRTRPADIKPAKKRIRIAFVGSPVRHKGWSLFKRLYREFCNSKNYRFYHFSDHNTVPNINKVNVRVTCQDKHAMIDALSTFDIDVVLHWAISPETFSYTAHEAYAAGAYIITNRLSGNVANIVNQHECGIVLNDEAELIGLMRSKRLAALVTEYRKSSRCRKVVYTMSRMSTQSLGLPNDWGQ